MTAPVSRNIIPPPRITRRRRGSLTPSLHMLPTVTEPGSLALPRSTPKIQVSLVANRVAPRHSRTAEALPIFRPPSRPRHQPAPTSPPLNPPAT